jgi:hypothetical protein
MQPLLPPACSFEVLNPSDVTDALGNTEYRLTPTKVRMKQLGLGFENFLNWAKQDVESAADADLDVRRRFTVSALLNARRSLSCFVDQYFLRDGLCFCKDSPRDANGKAELLVHRGIFDPLAMIALGRAVDRRNRVEHQYEELPLRDVQETVHLVRATIENATARSDPYWAPAMFGGYVGTLCGSEPRFDAWMGLISVFVRGDTPPWFGIVIPPANSFDRTAYVRKVYLRDLCCKDLIAILGELESQSPNGWGSCDQETIQKQLACLGLIERSS